MPRIGSSIAALCWLAACGSEDGGGNFVGVDAGADASGPGGVAPSFARHVQPVFIAKCNYCHHPDNATGVDLTQPFDPDVGIIERENTWLDAPSTLLVDPGRPENSFLLDKIRRTDLDAHIEGEPMPWHIPRLGDQEVDTLRQWISDGANDDDFYAASVAPIFGDGQSLGSRGGRCAYCHYHGGQRPDLIDPFDPATGAVGVTGIHGRVLIEPGEPDASFLIEKVSSDELGPGLGAPMPYHPPRVTQSEADAIERWIAAGAPDD